MLSTYTIKVAISAQGVVVQKVAKENRYAARFSLLHNIWYMARTRPQVFDYGETAMERKRRCERISRKSMLSKASGYSKFGAADLGSHYPRS